VNDEADDPWTFFGEFSKPEIDGASKLLTEAGITFEIKEDPDWKPDIAGGGWSGPHCLWVRDESIERATSLLAPFFKNSN
jgi:hypothetical protein